ncbi:mannose-6-phosphate isomerase [Trametes cingulata]|nr:mannose-6-phosphate isomerase [Trametes cingulata]
MASVFKIIPTTQQYDWGKIGLSSKVAQYAAACKLPGFTLDENAPYAELWMGTHHSSPSRLASTQEPLSAHLAAHPELVGARVVERFRAAGAAEGNLPFLFKVLAIGKALSIQTHPDKAMAERLHQERPDVYKDANHKPEMALALTPFQALCGFLPLPRIAEFLAAVPEFAALVPPGIISQFYTAAASADPTGPREKAALKDVFSAVMTADPDVFRPQLERLVRRYEEAEEGEEGRAKVHEVEREVRELVLRLHGQFPGDIGVFCAFMLNHLTLEPGQAIFLAAGEPHAYVSGDIVECMATSDNVIRAGLTPKLRDVPNLVAGLTYAAAPAHAHLVPPVAFAAAEHSALYDPPIPEFSVVRTVLGASREEKEREERHPGVDGPSIAIVTEGRGEVVWTEGKGGEERMEVGEGEVFFVGAGREVEFVAKGEGSFVVHRAFVEAK